MNSVNEASKGQKEAEIPRLIKVLTDELGMLEAFTESLQIRLSPVLRNDEPEPDETEVKGGVQVVHTDIGDAIHTAAHRVTNTSDRLQRILETLEL